MFKAYRGETLLLSFHDAFDGTLRISERIAEETVARFAAGAGWSPTSGKKPVSAIRNCYGRFSGHWSTPISRWIPAKRSHGSGERGGA